jgi:hypothetical protein
MDVMIVDNFVPFPKQVREWALQQEYMDAKQFKEKYGKHTDWPGLRTEAVMDLDIDYANVVFSRIAGIIQKNAPMPEINIKSFFQITREQDGSSWVHQDNDVKYAALLYLNPNASPSCGTTFYRCNDVNRWTSYMSDQRGYQTMTKINEKEEIDLYEELFTPTDHIGNVFNRLAIYKGDIFHKSSKYFGDDIRNGRLTQVFFINDK